jgi:hypothetical protein
MAGNVKDPSYETQIQLLELKDRYMEQRGRMLDDSNLSAKEKEVNVARLAQSYLREVGKHIDKLPAETKQNPAVKDLKQACVDASVSGSKPKKMYDVQMRGAVTLCTSYEIQEEHDAKKRAQQEPAKPRQTAPAQTQTKASTPETPKAESQAPKQTWGSWAKSWVASDTAKPKTEQSYTDTAYSRADPSKDRHPKNSETHKMVEESIARSQAKRAERKERREAADEYYRQNPDAPRGGAAGLAQEAAKLNQRIQEKNAKPSVFAEAGRELAGDGMKAAKKADKALGKEIQHRSDKAKVAGYEAAAKKGAKLSTDDAKDYAGAKARVTSKESCKKCRDFMKDLRASNEPEYKSGRGLGKT